MQEGRRSTATAADETLDVADPPEAFELLADETRFAIVRELRERGGGPICFTDLRKRAKIDDSSRFNYHLMRLTGVLVKEVEDGYELRPGAVSLLEAAFETTLPGGPRSVREAGD